MPAAGLAGSWLRPLLCACCVTWALARQAAWAIDAEEPPVARLLRRAAAA